jgi:hypothetical protein
VISGSCVRSSAIFVSVWVLWVGPDGAAAFRRIGFRFLQFEPFSFSTFWAKFERLN